MERLSLFSALAVTLALSLTLGAFAKEPKPSGHITFVSMPASETHANF